MFQHFPSMCKVLGLIPSRRKERRKQGREGGREEKREGGRNEGRRRGRKEGRKTKEKNTFSLIGFFTYLKRKI